MALGEAFVNVRADLKPFARDVDRDIKLILRRAERSIANDPSIGRALSSSVRTQLSDGVSGGLEEGFTRGTARGTRAALRGGQRFFAALADFADDGLSALPAEVKAVIVLGVSAGAIAAAPILSGAISAAITTGVALSVIGAGVALASQFDAVEDQFTAVGREILASLRDAASVFILPLLQAGADIVVVFRDVEDVIRRIFGQAALQVEPLTEALTGFFRNLLPGIERTVTRARPLIEALAGALPDLGRRLSEALMILAEVSPEAAVALRDLLTVIGTAIVRFSQFVAALTEVYFWLRIVGAAASGDVAGAVTLFAERERAAAFASGQLTSGLQTTNTALGQTATEALAAQQAISALLREQLKGVNATIDYEQAIDDLQRSIREGNRDFRVTEENGRSNLRLVETAIDAAARQRDAEIARATETGRSIESINAAYEQEIATIERIVGANIRQDTTLQELFATARSAPKDVAIQVTTPGLGSAIARWRELGAAIGNAAQAGAQYLRNNNPNGGLRVAVQYANGDIVSQPTLGLIGEAGYREAVIPDPKVMPGRAMQLANQFGLTSLIANSIGQNAPPVVNVYVGGNKLEEMVDFRIGVNNALNATAMAYGPRE